MPKPRRPDERSPKPKSASPPRKHPKKPPTIAARPAKPERKPAKAAKKAVRAIPARKPRRAARKVEATVGNSPPLPLFDAAQDRPGGTGDRPPPPPPVPAAPAPKPTPAAPVAPPPPKPAAEPAPAKPPPAAPPSTPFGAGLVARAPIAPAAPVAPVAPIAPVAQRAPSAAPSDAPSGPSDPSVASAAPDAKPSPPPPVSDAPVERVSERPPAPRPPVREAPPAPFIPPLPDDDEDFEPFEEEMPEAPREAPAGATAAEILEGVRAGTLHVSALSGVEDDALRALAESRGLPVRPGAGRGDLIYRLLHERPAPPPEPVTTRLAEGLLEILPDGYGFLRSPENGYLATPSDVYVPPGLIRRVGLLPGHWICGTAQSPRAGERYGALVAVESVNHEDPEVLRRRVQFEELTATHPDQRFILETKPEEVSMRIMDLFCPLGRGQRALIVSPPRAGKTVILQQIADSLARNSPNVDIIVLLLDERPEEVTNMRRSVRGEVFASTFDQPAHRHVHLAELVMEKVKRMVEFGRHVVLLLDSLTRLGRAYNNESGGTGRLLTGGMEASALIKPKRFFGSARNIEHGGSLTILATALVETGSRLDEVIFEEFKGTGNMELRLSRELANMRLWPAIDIPRSGTRKEELLLHPEEQRRINALRRAMTGQSAPEAIEDILERMKKYRTNAEFLMNVEV